MTDIFRGRYDVVANPKEIKEYPVNTAEPIEVGDLVWWDRVNSQARPASSTALWTGTEAGARGKLAENFIGVAVSAYRTGDVKTVVRVAGRGVWSYPLTSAAAFEIGNLVGGSKDTGGNYLYDQQVVKVTDESTAIGIVTRRYAAASSVVEFEIFGRTQAGGGNKAFLTS